jgi:hypothetical protein
MHSDGGQQAAAAGRPRRSTQPIKRLADEQRGPKPKQPLEVAQHKRDARAAAARVPLSALERVVLPKVGPGGSEESGPRVGRLRGLRELLVA